MPPQLTRAQFLASSLQDLTDYWVVPTCPSTDCPRTAIPCNLMVARGHGKLTLAAYIARLKCRHCGLGPVSVVITDDTAKMEPHGVKPWTWTVQLLP